MKAKTKTFFLIAVVLFLFGVIAKIAKSSGKKPADVIKDNNPLKKTTGQPA